MALFVVLRAEGRRLQTELEKLTMQVTQLQDEQAHLRAKKTEREKSMPQVIRLQQEQAILRAQNKMLQSHTVAGENRSLRIECEKLKLQVTQLQKEQPRLRAKNQTLQLVAGDYKSLQKECKKLTLQARQLQEEQASLWARNETLQSVEGENQSLQAELEKLTLQMTQLQEEKAMLRAQNETLQSVAVEYRSLQAKCEKVTLQVTQLQEEQAILRARNKTLQSVAGEKRSLENEVEKLMLEVTQLQKEQARLRAKNFMLQSAAGENRSLQNECEKLTLQVAQLQEEQAAQNETLQFVAGDYRSLQNECVKLTLQVTELQEEQASLWAQNETLQSVEGENQSLQAELEKLTLQMTQLQEEKAMLRAQNETLQSVAGEKRSLENEVEKLTLQVAQLQKEQAAQNETLQFVAGDYRSLQNECEKLTLQVTELQEEQASLPAQNETLQSVAGGGGACLIAAWEFMNHRGNWQRYEEEVTEKIMSMHASWHSQSCPQGALDLDDTYTIDFHSMHQENRHTGRRRDVRMRSACNGLVEELCDVQSKHQESWKNFQAEVRSMVIAKSVWSYELGDGYMPLQDQVSDSLEELYVRWEKAQAPGKHEIRSGGCSYRVDFVEMTQTNVKTGKTRKLQRKQNQLATQLAKVDAEQRRLASRLTELRLQATKFKAEQMKLFIEKQQSAQANQGLYEANQTLIEATLTLREETETLARENQRLIQETARIKEACRIQIEANEEVQQRLVQEMAARHTQLERECEKQRSIMINHFCVQVLAGWQQQRMDAWPEVSQSELEEDPSSSYRPDAHTVKVVEGSRELRQQMQSMSPRLLSILGDMTYIDCRSDLTIPAHSSDFLFLEHIFLTSRVAHRKSCYSERWCEAPKLRVISMAFVPCLNELHKKYKAVCEQMCKQVLPVPSLGSANVWRPLVAQECNEVLMFHGAPWEAVDSISASGFDLRHTGKHMGSLFGKGVYLAPNSSKCDFYASENRRGEKCMFLVRVALGASLPRFRPCQELTAETAPTWKHGETMRIDSICGVTRMSGGVVDHPEACSLSANAALPCVKIVYKHVLTCKCHMCTAC